MLREVIRFQLVCDSCGGDYEDEEFGGEIVFDRPERATYVFEGEHAAWTTDGEGRHHCWVCEPLELTEAAKAERARVPGPGDVPLLEVS